MTHILIIEDDPAIAISVQFALNKENWQTTWVSTVSDAYQMVCQHKFDVVLLDVGLPDGDGVQLCGKIGKISDVPIVFLTAKADEIDKVLGLEMGAQDYITKPFGVRELIARIRVILRRQTSEPVDKDDSFTCQILGKSWRYNAQSFVLSLNDTPVGLSKTELALLLTLIKTPHKVFSREMLLAHISDYPEHRTLRTVDAHIKAIRQKLLGICTDEIIFTHRGLGYSVGIDD